MDTKRLARFTRPGHAVTGDRTTTAKEKRARVGYEFVHSIIDDHSRVSYSEIHPDERAPTVTGFVARALDFYAGLGVHPTRLQTDNAWCYRHNRSLHELAERRGKVERYQQTMAREWPYGQTYKSSEARAAALDHWLLHYNATRNHSGIDDRPPITRIPVQKDPRHNT